MPDRTVTFTDALDALLPGIAAPDKPEDWIAARIAEIVIAVTVDQAAEAEHAKKSADIQAFVKTREAESQAVLAGLAVQAEALAGTADVEPVVDVEP